MLNQLMPYSQFHLHLMVAVLLDAGEEEEEMMELTSREMYEHLRPESENLIAQITSERGWIARTRFLNIQLWRM